ncbi:MAG: hypothetical protein Q8J67_02985, partial [Rhodocyclaceae bacterium]|nr:hypothetical protein [Rhodocyclaceae bacterium]
TPGQGSVFWMDLPIKPAASRLATPGQPPEQLQPASPQHANQRHASMDGAAIVRRLEKLLSEDDTRAAEVLAEGEAFLQQAMDWRFEIFARQVAGFEYDKALATLREYQSSARTSID